MQTWKCMVRMPSNFIQNIEVEAYTYSDAVSYAESSTGGKCINATPQWKSSVDEDDDNDQPASIDGAGILVLAVIGFVIFFWKYILIIGGIALLLWVIYHFMSE